MEFFSSFYRSASKPQPSPNTPDNTLNAPASPKQGQKRSRISSQSDENSSKKQEVGLLIPGRYVDDSESSDSSLSSVPGSSVSVSYIESEEWEEEIPRSTHKGKSKMSEKPPKSPVLGPSSYQTPPASGSRPSGSRPSGSRPSGSRPSGSRAPKDLSMAPSAPPMTPTPKTRGSQISRMSPQIRKLVQKTKKEAPEIAPRSKQPAKYICQTTYDCRRILSLDKDGVYKALRKELADEMTRTSWVNKSSSGDSSFNHLCEYAMDHKALKNLKPKWLEKASEDSIKIQAALVHLIVDLSQKRKRVDKRHDGALKSAMSEEEYYEKLVKSWEALGIPCRPAITVHVIDPEKATAIPSDTYRPYDWYGVTSLMPFTGILPVLSMRDLSGLALKRVPPAAPGHPKRAVRAFYGALSNSAPRGQAAYPPDPEYVPIGDSEDLEGWLRATEAKPLRLCAVLHRPSAIVAGPTKRPQTPPPEGWNYLTEEDINDIESLDEEA